MRYISVFMFTVISAAAAMKSKPTLIGSTPKFCIDCKFYIKPDSFFVGNEFGECSLFEKERGINVHFLVNGENNNDDDDDDDKEYYHCYTARKWEDMCGRGRRLYEKK